MFKRKQLTTLVDRIIETSRRLIVVSGPRQCGKTTLVLQTLGRVDTSHTYVPTEPMDFGSIPALNVKVQSIQQYETTLRSNPANAHQLMIGQWEEARAKARTSTGHVLILDEIPKIPNWSETVKALWDRDVLERLNLQVVLLGSAPLSIQSGLSESLLGRYEILELTHWDYREMNEAFDLTLDEFIYFGGYPGSADLIHDELRWRDYLRNSIIEPNIEKDVLSMQRVDKPVLLKRLFELACAYPAQMMSYNKMLGQLYDAGNTTTLARYLDLLSKVGLVTGLSNYRANAIRTRASSPKFIVLNSGLVSAQTNYTFQSAMLDRSHWGRVVENAVGAHLYNNKTSFTELYYWTSGIHEVDFVLKRESALIALEVKSGTRMSTKGLQAFKSEFPAAKTAIVGGQELSLERIFSVTADELFEEFYP